MKNSLSYNIIKILKKYIFLNAINLNIILAIIYFAFAKMGLLLATLNQTASPVWPATGFAFAIVYIFGKKVWPAIAIGAFVANYLTGGPLLATLLITLGNTLEALVGASIIHKIQSYRKYLSYQTEFVAFSLAAVLGSLVSASIGASALYFSHVAGPDVILSVWVTWWVGDTLGGLVITPILTQLHKIKFYTDNWLNAVGVVLSAIVISYFVFIHSAGSSFIFLLFPVVLFAVMRLGDICVLIISAFICIFSVVITVNGLGPFSTGDLNERLVHLQLFLAALAITSLSLSGIGRDKLTKVPVFILLLCWTLSGAIFYSFYQTEEKETQEHFANLVKNAQEKMLGIVASYEQALRGGAGLFSASKSVELKEWKAYNKVLDMSNRHIGMNGIGVIWPVKDKDLIKFQNKMRSQGAANFVVKPVPGYDLHRKKLHYVIKFIEPIEKNIPAMGLDVSSEKNRSEAAELSRDTGEATITSTIALVQDQKKSPGFLFYLPIYKNGIEPQNTFERNKFHLGWIYGPFIYEKFFSEVFAQSSDEIELQAFEGKTATPENLIFDNFSKNSKMKNDIVSKQARMGQKDFSLNWRKSPKFISSHNTIIAWVGFCGALASILFTSLVLSLQMISKRSRELAEELTGELVASREKFKEGERRLLYALDGSNDGIWDWNIEKNEMYVSGKMAENHGWPQTFYVKSSADLKEFTHPEDLLAIEESIRKVYLGLSKVHEVETRYRTKDGEWCWVLTRGKVSERDASGKPTRMTGVHIDIHALKKAQSLLVETQYQLRNIANSIPSLVSLWSKDLKCEFANAEFAKWFGLEPEKILGTSMKDILSPTSYENRKEIFEKALNGEHLRYEKEVVREYDGSNRYVVATYLPNKTENSTEGFFLFIQDITDLKVAELTAIEERKAAIEAASIKSQFLANMSHEIRTPINGIIGMANLLLGTTLAPRQKDYAEIIGRSSEALLNIINDILDFSKVEAGKLDLEIVDFKLENLIQDVIKSLSYSAVEKGLLIDTDLHFKTQKYFKGDPGRLRQVLTNLISNAIKFTHEGGVTLRLKIEEDTNSSLLNFEVIDTGIGIPEAAMSRMFQAFSQADASMSRRFGGTGLGLSISKQLVHLMGGEIGVKNNEKLGSNFWFKLKLDHGKMQDVEIELPKMIEASHGARVLVVEDNRVNQQIALEVLKNLGYFAHAVGNGVEALDALRDSRYDVVLMDCQMPEMDGYEATRTIRKSKSLGLESLPVIAMTANAMDGDREKCLEAGMNDYISKPIAKNQLLQVIEKWLHKDTSEASKATVESRGHILVVEDNKVNQNVICLNLENLSYTYDVAENGIEALSLLSKKAFDLVLMDCQMPEMDGYEATEKIRALKSDTISKIPIVALTANSMRGERERCLAVGMNDYLTKPIVVRDLCQIIKKHLKSNPLKQGTEQKLAKNCSVIDMTAIQKLQALQNPNQPDHLTNLISLFFESAEENIKNIQDSLSRKKWTALAHAAHSLKSSSANLGATYFSELCQKLEGIGNSQKNTEQVHEIFQLLKEEYVKVHAELGSLKLAS